MQDGKVSGLTCVADMAVVACSIVEHFNVVEDIGGVVCQHRPFSDDVADYVSNTDSRKTRVEQQFSS